MKWITLFFGIILMGGFVLFGIMHEKVHQAIYQDYGIESKIGIEFPNLVTTAEEGCENENCELAHEINEAVGYHLTPFYMLIAIGLFIIINFMEENFKK